ncbi:MAG: zinc ribbon domain-containing protein [Rudaea sp.]
MPIYEYAAIGTGCAHCQGRFDVLQKMRDDPVSVCPECGGTVTRVISVPSVASSGSHLLKEDHFSKHGFTQYRKAGGGVYEKTAGDGPKFIKGD